MSTNASADLKTYDVDPQYRQEIFAALGRILASSGPGVVPGGAYGRVDLLPSGQIIVNAPPATLEQVDQVLQTIRNRPAPAAPRVDLRYWAVLGTRTQVASAPGTPPPSALADVLAELERLHGDLQFRVIGTAALTSDSGQDAEVNGMALEVEQTAFVQGDTLNARIQMNLQGRRPIDVAGRQSENVVVTIDGGPAPFNIGSIEVHTGLRRGEFVVLGQSELVGGEYGGPVFFIVHWPDR
jgi:hypothetical protein